MDIFVASTRGRKTNTSYPNRITITSVDDLAMAAAYDHVCASYADGKNNRGTLVKAYRSRKTFISSNCLPMDCDNDISNPLAEDSNKEEWKTPADVAAAFPDVPFYVVYSRNHMKVKEGKAARPRFHVYFPIDEIRSAEAYEKLKCNVQKAFPAFDDNAIDVARFFFGVEGAEAEYYDGNTLINDFIYRNSSLPSVIEEGSRNATLVAYADKVLKRFGDTEKAYALYLEAAGRCEPPLDEDELNQIWQHGLSFYNNIVKTDPDYLTPDEFEVADFASEKKPVTSDDIKAVLGKMGITVRLNVITGQVDINGMPSRYSRENAPNTLPTLLTDYFSRRGIRVSRQTIDDSLVLIEDENRFNPIRDMLMGSQWDGQDRITELGRILGIQDNPRYMVYLTKWLHQCVSMALNDDREPYGADGVFVIQGEQGTGKTLFCRTVAMKSDWFAEGVSIDLDNKDSIIQGTGVWIAELGELDSTLKREQSAFKAFLTASKDTYRQPYARVAVSRPRRASFCGTVNPKDFLNDETGSRRYWVVQPEYIDTETLRSLTTDWLVQLWTQIYYTLFLPDPQGFRLSEEERAELLKANEEFAKPLPGELEILDKLDWQMPVENWSWKRVSSIKDDLDLRSMTAAQVGRALVKVMRMDDRIQVKSPGNVKHYLLPPRRCRYYGQDDISGKVDGE